METSEGWLDMVKQHVNQAAVWVKDQAVGFQSKSITNMLLHDVVPLLLFGVGIAIFLEVRHTRWGKSMSMLGICIIALVPILAGGVLFGLTTNLAHTAVH
jgi:hypothetical protein